MKVSNILKDVSRSISAPIPPVPRQSTLADKFVFGMVVVRMLRVFLQYKGGSFFNQVLRLYHRLSLPFRSQVKSDKSSPRIRPRCYTRRRNLPNPAGFLSMKPCDNQDNHLQQSTDDELLAQASQGNQEAFGQLYEKYIGRIYNYVYYRTGNSQDAEDLTARVFYRAMGHIHTYHNRGLPFSAWLYRIAHNLVANWHRDNSRRQEIPLDDGFMSFQRNDHPELELVHQEDRDRLFVVLRNLTVERQQLIILKFVDHLIQRRNRPDHGSH